MVLTDRQINKQIIIDRILYQFELSSRHYRNDFVLSTFSGRARLHKMSYERLNHLDTLLMQLNSVQIAQLAYVLF